MMTLQEVVLAAQELSIDERKSLIKALVDSLDQPQQKRKARNILEFEGVGAEMWQGVDAQDYVNRLRDEWDLRK